MEKYLHFLYTPICAFLCLYHLCLRPWSSIIFLSMSQISKVGPLPLLPRMHVWCIMYNLYRPQFLHATFFLQKVNHHDHRPMFFIVKLSHCHCFQRPPLCKAIMQLLFIFGIYSYTKRIHLWTKILDFFLFLHLLIHDPSTKQNKKMSWGSTGSLSWRSEILVI